MANFILSLIIHYLPLTSTSYDCPSLSQWTEGSGTPRGGEHSSKAGSPAATCTSLGSALNSSRRTGNYVSVTKLEYFVIPTRTKCMETDFFYDELIQCHVLNN